VAIGRDPSCDLHPEDEYVSRKHCPVVLKAKLPKESNWFDGDVATPQNAAQKIPQ